ncbi:MAG: hypothetical protein K0Q79_1281 [Flavipsychrobacter sp.]|jgi:hypothetical protein|nr:hypothetical protein [Flavipsychrobacter sp.]
MKKSTILFLLLCVSVRSIGQGTFSGDLMMQVNFFDRDTNIKASGNPLYDNYLSGSQGWLSLRYNVKGYTFFVRADAFNNSNLKSPTSANSDFGIGAWSVNKDLKDLSITVGSIYDQIGSGLFFRAYEDRGLLIDNALVGIRLKYKLTNNIRIKGFTGQQKDNRLYVNNTRYAPVIKALNIEGDFSIGNVNLSPGVGALNRTLDEASYQNVRQVIKAQVDKDSTAPRFTPVRNMYAFTAYNTVTYKNFSWYLEGAYKTHEATFRPDSARENVILHDKPGNVIYTSINYGMKGVALTLSGKRTEDFVMRTSPAETFSIGNGMLNWQPVIAVLRPERLISRYSPPSQDISEMAGTATLQIAPNDLTSITLSHTSISTLENEKLYRETYGDVSYHGFKSWILHLAVQYLEYNVPLYQGRKSTMLYALTPMAEITYRLSEKHSIRAEVQYMNTKQDYGSWIFALLEYNIAPKWSIALSDMYNTNVNKNFDNPNSNDAGFLSKDGNHYPSIFVAFTKGANRFTLAYVKQVDGINCSGGVCRYEPAFSGVRVQVTSSF